MRSRVAYGADIVAVAGGTVVSTMSTLDDQVPGQLPLDLEIVDFGGRD